jgi:LPS export ABC transporter protein LptC
MGKQGHTRAAPVRLLLFNEHGDTVSRILSDSGWTNAQHTEFRVWGNVHVWSAESLTIRAQSLAWDKETHRITSDSYVEIETARGDIMRGKGLTANESFTTWEFQNNVSGFFPDFEDRMNQEQLLQ